MLRNRKFYRNDEKRKLYRRDEIESFAKDVKITGKICFSEVGKNHDKLR